MLSGLKDLFNFNTTERNGIVVLIVLILLVAYAPRVYRYFHTPDGTDFKALQEEIATFEKSLSEDSLDEANKPEIEYEQIKHSIAEQKITPFQFNPNGLPEEKWKQLGLKDWQIKIIKKYESKGGKFYKKEDLKKIYGITETEFKTLEPYIVLPAPEDKPWKTDLNPIVFGNKRIIVNLNTADSTTLLELKGVGPSFARRIIKYREMLGGFYANEQLLEVYGFDRQRFDMLVSDCVVGEGPYKKINLNTITTADLKKHPYLDYYTAKAIVDRRITKGSYTSVDQLRDLPLITDDLFEKIRHYFVVD